MAGLDRFRSQFLEMGFFSSKGMAASLGDPAGFLVQRQSVEAHGPGHGLTMRETAVRRHQRVGVLGGNLDEKSEHTVVADFQRRDPGLVAVFRFQRGNRAPRIA